MKLHSLEISGFKSFVDPVELRFAGGITAIVGPNGCGKSNLSEAITWVLGEQSAKTLRSTTMEDVIFTGTDSRKPVGMAEVELTLATDPSFEHAQDGRMTIGRRVFRSGQSQYRINGKIVRLKEIKDLLMDTGLGIRAYSVIEQGKIGMILSGKPQERRKLLEEAAGVTRYKARKRIAEVKLEEATANLLRLDDIVSEVERALRSLKRQAAAARRYQSKEGEYRELLDRVLQGRWALLAERLGELEARLAAEVGRDAELAAALHRHEAELAAGREELDVLAAAVAERHQAQAELAATIEGRQEYLKGARQRLAEVAERRARGEADAERRGGQGEELRGSLGSLDERGRELVAERDEAARLVAEDDAAITAAQRGVEEAETRIAGLRRELMTSLERLDALRGALQRRQVETERRVMRRRYLDEERERVERQVAEARTAGDAVAAKIAEHEAKLGELGGRREELKRQLDRQLAEESRLTDEARATEGRVAGLRQRREILAELSAEHAERRRALVEKLAACGLEDPTFLAERIRPVEGWEDAIDHFLGDLADAVVLGADDDPLTLARGLSERNGFGTFVRPLPEGAAVSEVDDAAVVVSLAEALDLPTALARSLPPAYLVREPADAARLAAAHPGVAFLSRDRLWAEAGLVRVQGAEAAPGVLARESELDEIGAEIPRLEERAATLRGEIRELVTTRTRHAAEIHRSDEQIAELRREVAVGQARRQDAAARLERLEASRRTLVDELGEIAGELVTDDEEAVRRRDELVAAEAAHRELTQAVDDGTAEVEARRERREALRTAGAGRRGRLELIEERLESHDQEAARVRRQVAELGRLTTAWESERETLDQRRRELELGIERAEEELQVALERRAGAQDEVLTEQAKLDARREALRALERQVQGERETRDGVRGELETLRVDRAGLRQDAEHLVATYRDEFRAYLPGTRPAEPEQLALAGDDEDDDEVAVDAERDEEAAEEVAAGADAEDLDVAGDEVDDEDGGENGEEDTAPAGPLPELASVPPMTRARLAELEAELSRTKAILERLGPVNVLAAKEYDEQEERHAFLTAQRADVVESVDRLKRTIHEINETSSQRFRETFAAVNVTFGEVFARLFRGGEASMHLLDEDDPLETGIEIIARPPGKRTQNIMLLSGGEKALTAIALLFALFQAKPSPFCILDEVDAPLDDANVLRFVETLKEMAADTQFIVVTHNKLTMNCAGTLYGVTMEEKGVSKLVAVELEDVQPEPEAISA